MAVGYVIFKNNNKNKLKKVIKSIGYKKLFK